MPERSLSRLSVLVWRYLPRVLLAVLALLAISLSILAYRWPFTREKSLDRLEHFAFSKVHVSSFHQSFFPTPGYVAEGLVFTRDSKGTPVTMATVQRFTCRASWWTMLLLRDQLKQVRLSKLVVRIPNPLPAPLHLHTEAKEATVIKEIIADGALLEVEQSPNDLAPSRFGFPELALKNVSEKTSVGFRTVMEIPKPTGTLSINGDFGPVNPEKPLETPVAGAFNLANGNLGCFHSLSGLLSGSGSFHGRVARVVVQGTANIPNFALSSVQHSVALRGEFHALVKGENGDVSLESARVSFPNTIMNAQGSISSKPGQPGKTVSLDIEAKQGRVEDLLRLLLKADPPALDANISFKTHAELPDGDGPFLRRVGLTGNFRITRAQFSKLNSRNKLDQLSAHVRGDKREEEQPGEAPAVVFDFNAPAMVLRDGTAHFSNTLFTLPGGSAKGSGTYNLLDKRIDWTGDFAMRTDLSGATTGLKSILLKPLAPFFRGKHSGAVVPIHVGGTYSHPLFELSLKGKK